jgi:predicted Zn-dependent protease
MKKQKNILFVITLLFFSGCMVNPVTLKQEFNIVSEEKELRIGRNAHKQIVRQFGLYYDTAFQQYVNQIGQKMAGVSRRRDITYHFTILDDDMKNAFAIPGGYIYITRGLLSLINNEAELAGVLAHEVGHVTGRDSAALMSQGMIAQLASIAGIAGAAATSSGDAALAANQLFSALMLGFSREKEYLSDQQAVEYLMKTGYDPLQMVSFMYSLSHISQGPTGAQGYLVTHPYIFDRISRIEAKYKVTVAMNKTMEQLHNRNKEDYSHRGKIYAERYKSYLNGLAYGPRNDIRHIKLYTVRRGDTLPLIARRTLGSSVKARVLAELNGIPVSTQLIPGATIKIIY